MNTALTQKPATLDWFVIRSLATGDYLPERHPTRDAANHGRVVRFGCRMRAYDVIRVIGPTIPTDDGESGYTPGLFE